MMQKLRTAFFFVCMVLLGGCHFQDDETPSVKHHKKQTKGIYRCTATNSSMKYKRAVGSGTNKEDAKGHALKICQSISHFPKACHISSCRLIRERPLNTPQWYTCYVQNRVHRGVWSGTAQNKFTATSHAFNRCRKLSGSPANCYVDYCRSW